MVRRVFRVLSGGFLLVLLGATVASAQQFDPLHHVLTSNSPLHVRMALREIANAMGSQWGNSASAQGDTILVILEEMGRAIKHDLQPAILIQNNDIKVTLVSGSMTVPLTGNTMNGFLNTLGEALCGEIRSTLNNRYQQLLKSDVPLRDRLAPVIDTAVARLIGVLGKGGAAASFRGCTGDFSEAARTLASLIIDRIRTPLLYEARRMVPGFDPGDVQHWTTFINGVVPKVKVSDEIADRIGPVTGALLDRWHNLQRSTDHEKDSVLFAIISGILTDEGNTLDLSKESSWIQLKSTSRAVGSITAWLNGLMNRAGAPSTFQPTTWRKIVVAEVLNNQSVLSRVMLADVTGSALNVAYGALDRTMSDLGAAIKSALADVQTWLISALPGLSVAESVDNVRAGMHMAWNHAIPEVGYWQLGLVVKGEFSRDKVVVPQLLAGMNGRFIFWIAQLDGMLTVVRSTATGGEYGLGLTFNLGDAILGASAFGAFDIDANDPGFARSWSASATIRAASTNTPILSFGAARFGDAPITPLLQVSYNVLF